MNLSTFSLNDPSLYSGKVSINPSEQQGTFFTFLVKDSRSCILHAAAGAGKTTTIVEGCKLLKPGFSARFVAFNKSIASELEARLPRTVVSSTFHSAWLSALQRSLPRKPKVDGKKIFSILKASLSYKDFEVYGKYCNQLVGLAKNAGVGVLVPDEPSEWFALIHHHNLFASDESLDEQRAVAISRQTLAGSNSDLSVIDFDDMLYLALLRNVVCDKSNYLFVDEAQDLNGLQHELLKRMIANVPGCPSRLIAVGDTHQAIYGFRGAASDSLDQLKVAFNAEVLPLSVSYRCSKAVVAEAQRVLEMYNLN